MTQERDNARFDTPPADVVARALAIVQERESARWSEEEWDVGLVSTVLAAQRASPLPAEQRNLPASPCLCTKH